jgi:hypothetical protein
MKWFEIWGGVMVIEMNYARSRNVHVYWEAKYRSVISR